MPAAGAARRRRFASSSTLYPDFEAQIEERIAQYDYRRTARVPLDFAEEILPAEAAAQEEVGPDQVDAGRG